MKEGTTRFEGGVAQALGEVEGVTAAGVGSIGAGGLTTEKRGIAEGEALRGMDEGGAWVKLGVVPTTGEDTTVEVDTAEGEGTTSVVELSSDFSSRK